MVINTFHNYYDYIEHIRVTMPSIQNLLQKYNTSA